MLCSPGKKETMSTRTMKTTTLRCTRIKEAIARIIMARVDREVRMQCGIENALYRF